MPFLQSLVPRACKQGIKSKAGAIKCCKEIKITAPPLTMYYIVKTLYMLIWILLKALSILLGRKKEMTKYKLGGILGSKQYFSVLFFCFFGHFLGFLFFYLVLWIRSTVPAIFVLETTSKSQKCFFSRVNLFGSYTKVKNPTT